MKFLPTLSVGTLSTKHEELKVLGQADQRIEDHTELNWIKGAASQKKGRASAFSIKEDQKWNECLLTVFSL